MLLLILYFLAVIEKSTDKISTESWKSMLLGLFYFRNLFLTLWCSIFRYGWWILRDDVIFNLSWLLWTWIFIRLSGSRMMNIHCVKIMWSLCCIVDSWLASLKIRILNKFTKLVHWGASLNFAANISLWIVI